MKVEKLISEYNRSSKKEEFFNGHIIKKYVPYEQKMAEARKIVDLTSYTTVNDKKVFRQNTPQQYLLFTVRLILNYTDIEIPDEQILYVYNELNKNNMIMPLISAIPQNEYAEFDTVLKMTLNDELQNFRSFSGFLDTKFEALEMAFKSFQDTLVNEETLTEIIKKIGGEQ